MNRIREYRKKKNLTLRQLGDIVGVAESTLSKYEHSINEPDLRTLTLIANALEVSIDDLLGRRSDQEENDSAAQQSAPKTPEARIVSGAMDKLPQDQREQILNILKAVFSKHPEIFEEDNT